MEYSDIVICLALAQYLYFTMVTGLTRGKLGVQAPRTTGNEEFERRFRVQQNTLEQLIVFVPAMFLYSAYVNAHWAAGIGIMFIVGRMLYANTYVNDPGKRAPGMVISFLANCALVLGSIIGIVWELV